MGGRGRDCSSLLSTVGECSEPPLCGLHSNGLWPGIISWKNLSSCKLLFARVFYHSTEMKPGQWGWLMRWACWGEETWPKPFCPYEYGWMSEKVLPEPRPIHNALGGPSKPSLNSRTSSMLQGRSRMVATLDREGCAAYSLFHWGIKPARPRALYPQSYSVIFPFAPITEDIRIIEKEKHGRMMKSPSSLDSR